MVIICNNQAIYNQCIDNNMSCNHVTIITAMDYLQWQFPGKSLPRTETSGPGVNVGAPPLRRLAAEARFRMPAHEPSPRLSVQNCRHRVAKDGRSEKEISHSRCFRGDDPFPETLDTRQPVLAPLPSAPP